MSAPAAGDEPGIELRLLQLTIAQLVRNVWTIWVICLFLAFTWWRHTLPLEAYAWLALLVLGFVLRAWWLRPARELAVLVAAPERWRRRFRIGMVATGLIVAAGPLASFERLPDTGRMYMTMVLCSWLAGAMAVFGPMPRDYALYAVLFIGGLVLAWLRSGSPYLVDIAVMLIVYVMVLAGFARNFTRLVGEGMSIRYTNEHLLAELRQAKEAAEEANHAKTRFLAVASHDLRQPLHALMLLNGLLQHATSPERAREVAAQMARSLQVLDHLFGSLLDFSRLDSARVEPSPRWHDCAELLAQAVAPLQGKAEARGLQFSCDAAEVEIHTDADLLARVVRNLVDNAIKFTPAGSVRVRAELGADRSCTITVSDSGRGIPVDLRGDVFKEYFQIVGDRSNDGLGLGLAIVQRLARLLKLQLSVADNPGGGTRFGVRVPPQAVRPVPAQAARELEADSDHAPLRPLTVLCIDDDAASLAATTALLRSWGLQAIGAGSADEALAQAAAAPAIEVVLSDYRLGNGETGNELIYRLRQRLGEIPAALITGDADALRAHRAGQIEFPVLTKPVDPNELRRLLEVFQELE